MDGTYFSIVKQVEVLAYFRGKASLGHTLEHLNYLEFREGSCTVSDITQEEQYG